VLHPVDIDRDGAGARGYRLAMRRDEPPIVNQSLLRLIFNKKRFVFSEDLSDELDALASDSAQGADGVRRKLAEVGVALAFTASPLRPFADRDDDLDGGKEFLEVEPCAVLGLFPQSNSDLLQDYDGLLQELGTSRADVNTLLASATALLPASLVGPRRDQADASLDQGMATPVIRADPSQRTVIGECRRHGAMVIDGPPGTGKSQVIVNLIAEALRRGERVAVVCEKRAALDVVVQRLEGLGLRHAIGVVHDVHEDRKLLYEQIAARLEQVDARPFDAGEAARLEREHAESGQALKVRAQALRMRPEGLSLSTGEILSAASGIELDPIRVRGLDTIDQGRLKKLLELATSLFALTDLWAPDSRWRRRGATERPELADADAHALQRLEQAIEAAGNAAREHEAVVSRTTAPVDPIEHAREAVQVARRTRDLRQSPEDGALLLALAEGAPADIESATREIELTWTETGSAMERVARRIEFEPPPEFVTALSVLRSWGASWIRFFVLGWWTARSAFRRELARSWPERAGERLELQLLDAVSDRIHASRGWRVASELLARLRLGRVVPATASELGELVRRIARASKAARDLAKVRSRLVAAGAWPASYDESNLAAWEQTLDEHARLIQARAVLRQKAAAVTAAFPWIGELPTQSELDTLLHDLRRDASRLVESDRLRSHARRILPEAPALFDALLAKHAGQGPSVWRSAITKSWACAWIERVETSLIPGFGRLGTRADDQEVVQLAGRHAELEEELREVAIERVLARVDDAELLRTQAASKHERRTTVQKLREELLKETRKKRRIMPLRSFVRRYSPQGLLGVLPVWLLSPETMAILFPRQALFDLVIFDEASQCTVEAGIPVLLRAKRVVIAGDEKQMPPSSYFDLATESDDDGVPESSEAETQRELRDLLAEESLLKLARTRIAHRGLEWHYRCRDEALIAFSNHAMYHGELRTIPARTGPAAPSALRWVAVPDGSYHAGENRREAARVVELMHELLTRDEPPSIGIVTFNLKQRRLVLDAIDERKASDPDFARRYAVASETDSLDERPFVKNLEQVQGDERDVIIFSLGHAPQERRTRGGTVAEKYVPARFGPLNARGGERRLNVAISRAKTECYIVASFEPAQLKVEAVTNEGPKLFKQYLEFAFLMHQGRHLEAERVLDLVRAARLSPHQRAPRSPIEGYVPLSTQIAMALEAEAIPHEINVGKSSFQVPIAVLDPSDPTRFALAILLEDGTGEVASFDPFDVHVHQPSVLRDRSWQALRITAASWHRRRREVLDEIERLVPGARGAANNEIHRSHREARRVIAAPPPPLPTRRLRKSSHPAIAVAQAPASVPSWAAAIENPHFQKALLQLAEHGSLGEVDVISIVGGPRKARLFARELESWRDRIPFRVEIVDVKGTKVYRKIGD
jgi:RecA/RadA recombinase